MIFIPIWITNILFLLSCVCASYQHRRLNRENPFTTLQFGIMVFSIIMVVVVVLSTRHNRDPWLSLVFFLIAVSTFYLSYRQFRLLPPGKAFE